MAGSVKLLAIAVALSPLALASAIAPAWAEDVDYLKRFSSSDVTMVANKDTLLSAAEIGVYQFGSVDNVVSLKRAKLESVDGLIVNISEGFYYPRLSLLSVPDGVSLQMAQPRFGSLGEGEPPWGDSDVVELTCKNGKIHKNGQNTGHSSACVGPSLSMTCNPTGTGAVFDFDDETCSGPEL